MRFIISEIGKVVSAVPTIVIDMGMVAQDGLGRELRTDQSGRDHQRRECCAIERLGNRQGSPHCGGPCVVEGFGSASRCEFLRPASARQPVQHAVDEVRLFAAEEGIDATSTYSLMATRAGTFSMNISS